MTLTQISSRGVEDALRWSLGAGGSNYYTFTGPGLTGTVNNPTIYLSRGHTYIFENNNSANAHPFQIQSTSGQGGTAYNTGVTNNGGGGGSEIKITVPHGAPDILYYQCTAHANMGGTIYITGAVADGTITTAKLANSAVTSAKIANGTIAADKLAVNAVTTANITGASVTTAKLANNAVNGNILADNSVSTTKIQDDAVTNAKMADNSVNSNNYVDGSINTAHIADGSVTNDKIAGSTITSAKIANGTIVNADISNGALIQGGKIAEMISGNTNNRVITATGSTNTFQAESGLIYDGSTGKLGINATSGADARLSVVDDSSYEGFNVKHSNLSAGIAIGYDTIRAVGTNTNNSLNISTKGTSSNLNCQIGSYNVFGGMSDSRDFRIFKNANGWSTLTMDADGGITGPLRRHVRRMNNGQNSVATINVFRLRRYNWGSGFFEVRMYATYYNGSYLRRFRINGHGAGGNYYSVKTMDDNYTDGGNADWGVGCQIANASNSAPGDNTTYFCDVQVTIPNYWYGLCELVMSSGYQTNNASAGSSMGSNSYTLWS